nr:MAG TPA: hypothetical protein [Caudoviricetes sp.]
MVGVVPTTFFNYRAIISTAHMISPIATPKRNSNHMIFLNISILL